MKKKPLMISAMVFGGIGLAMIIVGIVFYMNGDTAFFETLAKIFGMTKDKITATTLCQFGVVFEIAAFVLAYRSLKDEDFDPTEEASEPEALTVQE